MAVSVAGAAYLADSCFLVLGEREVCTLEVDMAKHPSPVEQEIARLALALPRREPPGPAYVQAPSCKGGARTPGQTVEEPTAASRHAGRGAVATLARGATPPQGLGGPRRATVFRSAASDEEEVAEEEEGSRWLAQSMRWNNRVFSRRQGLPRQRTSAVAGSSSLPPPPLLACASCETGTSANDSLYYAA